MADRPDFETPDHDLLIRMEQMLLDMSKGLEKLTGNGRPGLCETRGKELVEIRERLSHMESAVSTVEIMSLRKRVGKMEDFRLEQP